MTDLSRRVTVALSFTVTMLSVVTRPCAADPNGDALIGIWGMHAAYTPGAHGDLVVKRGNPLWLATIGGKRASFYVEGSAVRFSLPKNQGSFRGTLSDSRTEIRGFWLQPRAGAGDPRDPGGLAQSFASPLTLRLAEPGTWSGTVKPLSDEFTLYLAVFAGKDGGVLAAFRNPEMNSNGGANQFNVKRTGDNIIFYRQLDASRPEIRISGRFEHSSDRIMLTWPDLGRPVELARLSGSQADNFFPRPPANAPYAYAMPPQINDGWVTASASDVGMDESALARFVQRIASSDPSSSRPPLIHSVLIARHGKLVLEEYFFGYDRERVHDLRSAGKTYASAMVGTAMHSGVSLTPQTRVYELLDGLGPFANPDPRKANITLADLMTHTSGLACNDNDDASPGNEGTMQSQTKQQNWWKYTLDLPMAHDPGSRYAYCSANINLVGAGITTATKTWLPQYFDQTIAQPLQFGRYCWNLMPTGEGYLGGGAYVRPRDFLKLGQLYLNGGVWNGKQIVDPSWIADSTASHVTVDEATTGLSADEFSNFYEHGEDGYAWHLGWLTVGDRKYREYGASGNGGQLLVVIPELDMVVAFTAGNYGQGGIWLTFRDKMIPESIIPAIVR